MEPEDLWGDMPDVETLKTPLLILKEQAELLQEKTKGMLVGQIVASQNGQNFTYTFSIVAPTLNNYTYRVLMVSHALGFYPAVVYDSQKNNIAISCENEEEYKKCLSGLFSSEKNKAAISKLLTHITSTS